MKSDHTATEYRVRVEAIRWLSMSVFELNLEKPAGFSFLPGQKISCVIDGLSREYSLAGSPGQDKLAICIRLVPGGTVSPRLAELNTGDIISISAPYGYFLYRPGRGRAVFVATGTGMAPFVSYSLSGVKGYIMLHGEIAVNELYYRNELQKNATLYVPCLSDEEENLVKLNEGFSGRVTTYLRERLPKDTYTFYLCGNGAMIRDAVEVIDRQFPMSRVFTETFFISD